MARRDELRPSAIREERIKGQRRRQKERIDEAREHLGGFAVEREAAGTLPRRQRREKLARIDSREAWTREGIAQLEAQLREMAAVGDAARHELAIIAARISPPAYVKAELGERPSDPAKRKAWDRGVSEIERYRQENGVKDPKRTLGQEAKRGAERARQQATLRRVQEMQRVLGLGQHAARARQLGGDWESVVSRPRPTGD